MAGKAQVGKIYSSGGTHILCTGEGENDRRFAGIVVEQLDPTSDHHYGLYSNSWTWHPDIFTEYDNAIIISNQYWKEHVPMGTSQG